MKEQAAFNQSVSMDWLVGGGEMGKLIRSMDWSKNPLGPVEQWPQSLRTTVSLCLASNFPISIAWGPNHVQIYNDGYWPICGAKHPSSMGQDFSECWASAWPAIGDAFRRACEGETSYLENQRMFLDRNGYLEETFFTFSFSPIRDESGGVGGLFHPVTELTQQTLAERRLQVIRDLSDQTTDAKTVEDAIVLIAKTLSEHELDLPFVLIYLVNSSSHQAHLVEQVGIASDTIASPAVVDLESPSSSIWMLEEVWRSRQTVLVENLEESLGSLSCGPYPEPPKSALVLPINLPGMEHPFGLMVAGVSSRRPLDQPYRTFYDMLLDAATNAISKARAYEAERQRAEALAEIDRAKTVFFSNVSHEFRTPLTLMLAPTEDALADTEVPLPSIHRDRIELVHRNSLRLLKLVNTLLDFSRIEAGRIQAVYEPTDLATLTTELASTFRSLIERAGMALVVECSPLPEPVYVDREMWEKIVLNLISNAFKFTFSGTITVRLQTVANHVNLIVEDTGIGIPPDELPHLFERFHRIKGAQGRSFEGSGIGLSLVQELVKLHGGTISVTSTVGQGSCFTVSIPKGTDHLPPDRIGATRILASTGMGVTPYIEEALRWLPTESSEENTRRTEWEENHHEPTLRSQESPDLQFSAHPTGTPAADITQHASRILVVDDNADMRNYVKRLLGQRYDVDTAEDGIAALNAIHQRIPDLVLTDVMMPRLGGFGLLQELREDPQTRELPIILLSARAGEESRIEGLEAGADDYLIKPFSNRELLARVEACLKMAQIRKEATLREHALRLTAEQAQRETRQTFERLTELLESMSDAFIELDNDWRITYQNTAAEQINNGKPRSQVIGKTLWEEFPAAMGTPFEYQYRKAVAEKIPVHFEQCYYSPPNFNVWLEVDAYPSEKGLAIFFRDITERKQAERVLREREEILQLFFKYVPTQIAMFDRQMNYLMASQRWVEDFNLGSVESVIGRSHYDIFPNIPERWKSIHQRCFAGAIEQCDADQYEREDGNIQWLRWEVRPWYQANQDIGGIIIFSEDITERRQAEDALRESQLQLQQQLAEIEAIYQSAPIGLNVVDTDLRFVRINQRLAEMNGISVEAHIGRTIRELLPELADAAEQVLHPVLETGEPILNVEICGETPAQPGVKRTWLESFLPLKDGDRVIGISTVCEEITERKHYEQQRQQAEEALRRAKEELESRVVERTLELQKAYDRLHQELLQREQIEQQLRQSKARYRAIVEDQTELIARFKPDSTILFVNDAYCRFFGVQQEDILGKSYNPVIYEADRERVNQLVQSMSAENPMLTIENRVIDGRGEIRWTQWANRMLFDVQGNVIELQSVGRDITELKQAEQALRESEERLQLALEASGDGIWDWNIAKDEIYYSPQYFQMLGYEPHELPHTLSTWEQLVHPEDMVWVREILADHFRDNSVRYEFDYRLRTKSGEWKWIADYGKVVAWDEAGNPVRMIGTHRDMTDRKRMEAALRYSEEQRRLALDLTHIGCWDLHLVTGEITWNDNHFTLLGLPVSSTAPHYEAWIDRIHPDDVKRVEQTFLNSIATHTDYEAEYRVIYPDGSEHWLMARGRAIYDEHNQPVRSLGVILDISDRKHIEASLLESDRRWQSLLDNVQLVVIGLDINGNVEYVNPFFLKLTGYQLDEVLGQYWFRSFLTPSQQTTTEVAFREVLEHNFHTHYQNPILTKSGDERMIAWSNTVLRNVAGQVIGTISIGEDITERYKLERIKAEFISVVSHELRTPLTSMQAALSLLSEKIIDPTSEEGEATIQIATEGTDRLVRLVNDILDLERLESGKVRLDKCLCNVNDLVDTAVAQMQEMANQVGITLEVSPCDFRVYADGDRLLQVLTNLLSNAIKFSPNGSHVWLSVKYIEQGEEGLGDMGDASDTSDTRNACPLVSSPFLLFKVKDQGRGIPADNLESIFDRFHQVDASDSREKGGTGLGLAICRSIVQQHGGEIWATSTIGKGSTFYFTIPMASEETGEPK